MQDLRIKQHYLRELTEHNNGIHEKEKRGGRREEEKAK